MKIKYLLFAIAIMPLLANAQDQGRTTLRTQNAYTDLINKASGSKTSDEPITGSPYYKKEFALGKIYVEDKAVDKDYSVRYNAYKDEIEVHNGYDIEYLFKDQKISCLIGNERYVYHPLIKKETKKIQLGYLKVLFEGDHFSLFMRKTKRLRQGKKAQTTLTSSLPPKLIDIKQLYFSRSKQPAFYLKQKKKTILSIIAKNHQSKMSEFLKSNHLNIKKTDDLIVFFKHYDSLISNKE